MVKCGFIGCECEASEDLYSVKELFTYHLCKVHYDSVVRVRPKHIFGGRLV